MLPAILAGTLVRYCWGSRPCRSALAMAVSRRGVPRGSYWTGCKPPLAYVSAGLRRELCPERIVSRLALDHPDDPNMRVSHTAIYTHIRQDRLRGGVLYKGLRRGHKRRGKRYGSRRGSLGGVSRTPCRVSIDKRPAEVESRETPDDWEADTVLGVNGRLGTFVERKSRFLAVASLPDGTATAFNAGAIKAFAKIPASCRLTMTADNGGDFAGHGELAGRLGFKTYFADPYSVWRRGTNENTNGLPRQYFPKGDDFATLSGRQLAAVVRKPNNRPGKSLAYRTPAEVFHPSPGRLLQLKSSFTAPIVLRCGRTKSRSACTMDLK